MLLSGNCILNFGADGLDVDWAPIGSTMSRLEVVKMRLRQNEPHLSNLATNEVSQLEVI